MPDGERWNPPEPASATAVRMRDATEQLRLSNAQDYPTRRELFDTALSRWNAAGRPPWR